MSSDLSYIDRLEQRYARVGTSLFIRTYLKDTAELVDEFEFTGVVPGAPIPVEVQAVARTILSDIARLGPGAKPVGARTVNGSTVLSVGGVDYAAIPIDDNKKAILIGGGGHLREPHAARGGLGDVLVAWDTAPSSTTSSSRVTDLSVMCPDPDYSSYIAKLDGTGAAGEIYQHTPGSAISMAGVNSIGFWAMAPVRPSGEHYTPIKIMLASTAWTVFGTGELTIRADGVWRYYTCPMECFVATGGWIASNDIVQIRLREGDSADGRTVLAVGESFYIGPIRKNPRGRAVGMIRFDDNIGHLYSTPIAINAFTGDSGVSISAGSYTCLDLVEAFGFKANAYVLTDFIGQLGFETEAGLRALQDTYGWDIAFQAKANSVGISNSGVRLLGPLGYGLVPIGGVASVDTAANTITCSAVHGVLTTGNVNGLVQPFPAEFIGTDLPAPLVTGQKYYLSNANSPTNTAFKVHTTAMGSVTAADIVDLASAGTAANFGVRYWGSANDYTAILAEFQNGQAAMQAMGFKAYKHYALNQGAFDIYSERAAIEAGFKTAWSTGMGDAVTDGGGWRVAPYECAFDIQGSPSPTTFAQNGCTYASWLNIPSAIQTDGTPTASDARTYVRRLVAYGIVGGNYHHSLTIANAPVLLAYLDELKVQSDRGLLDVMTITEFQKRVEASV